MTAALLVLDPADVTVTIDRFGREVVVIPDGVAAALTAEIQDGWTEYTSIRFGESRRFGPDTWVYQTTVTLLKAFAASAAPTGLDDDATWRVERARTFAAQGVELYAAIVSASGWHCDDRTWHDYEYTRDLRIQRSIHRRGPDYRYEG